MVKVLVPGIGGDSWDEKMRDLDGDPWTIRVVQLKCPACRGAIVAAQMLMETDENDIPIWSCLSVFGQPWRNTWAPLFH